MAVNPYSLKQYVNNSSDLYNYQISRIFEGFYDKDMTNVTDGKFKAICLSGIRTEDNTGGGTDPNDGTLEGKYINIIVKPLTPFGDSLPDPREYNDPDQINFIIGMYRSTFTARSDYSYDSSNPISFGQIIDCYLEQGSISNSDFTTLRFMEPKDNICDESFQELSTIQGVKSMSDKNWSNAGFLGNEQSFQQGKTSNVQGVRGSAVEYLVIHYSAAFGGKDAVLQYENNNTKFGYHYMIDRDGSFYQTAEDDDLVFHAAGNQNVTNSNSIGICLMNVGYERPGVSAKSDWITGKVPNQNKSLKWEPYTEESLNTAAKICAELLTKYELTIDRIMAHSDLQTEKQDPGPAFSMLTFKLKVYALMNSQTAGA